MSSPSVSLPLGAPSRRARAASRALATALRPELVALLALAGILDLWALDRNGAANDYYTAAVRSMTSSWHAFLFGSFDPSGVMTVDKPPLALWVQALSARVFGLSSWSILVPQALMGVATVALTYDLTRRLFGRAAGFTAGLVLALTPITVAISRHNNPDALLVLCSVAALWCLVRALHDGRTGWLVLAGVAVGLGFEAKMAVALMVVPGVAVAWLWMAPRGRLAALRQLLAGGAAMLVVGLAWPVLMWLTPAADRPWISGTSDNSIWSLIFGYNGLGRLVGQSGGPGGGAGGPGGPGGFGNGGPFGGSPGVLRLLNTSMGGQAGWLLGFAILAGVAIVVATRLRRADPRTGWIIAVGGAFAVTAVAFSKAQGIFHPYYVSLLAPFTAALVGAGVGEIVRGDRRVQVLGGLAVAAGVATEVYVIRETPAGLGWLVPVLVAGAAVGAFALFVGVGARARAVALAAVMALLLFAPASWAFRTLDHATNGTFPAGGPASAGFGLGGPGGGAGGRGLGQGGPTGGFGQTAGGGPFGGYGASLTQAVAYARAHGGGTIAVSSQTGASAAIISSGADVAGIGGFSGRESQVSLRWLADAVASGRIRWAVADGSGFGGLRDGRVAATDAMAAIRQVGRQVGSVSGLYDVRGTADALRALAAQAA